MNMKIGMLTSGGDCQGLNAALRGVAKTLYNEMGKGVTLYGIRDGYRGLIEGDYHEMKPDDFSDILTLGGTILGTSRQPFKQMQRPEEDSEQTKLDKMLFSFCLRNLTCKGKIFIIIGHGSEKLTNLLCHKLNSVRIRNVGSALACGSVRQPLLIILIRPDFICRNKLLYRVWRYHAVVAYFAYKVAERIVIVIAAEIIARSPKMILCQIFYTLFICFITHIRR